ncbi:MAG TPA: hypothetical protein VGG74_19395 [Kofleriaceae bacterium]|jgi:hypothetical protein
MAHKNADVAGLLAPLDLGVSVAELDNLLDSARVETSAFSDLFNGRVDLIPGTKGSGKSALFRLTVEYLRDHLLKQRRVVIAHGVKSTGDVVFTSYRERFDALSEDDFVDFWCLYFASLAREHFVNNESYVSFFKACKPEIQAFRDACTQANLPELEHKSTIEKVLEWVLNAVRMLRPKAKANMVTGELQVELFAGEASPNPEKSSSEEDEPARELDIPRFAIRLAETLDQILIKTDLQLWLMVDRLDELFLRRSKTERLALRGLLRTMRIFSTAQMSLKVFLRDDILDDITREGFTALSHVTAKSSTPLSWNEDQILTLIVNRLFANEGLRSYLQVDLDRLGANQQYREESFYKVFPRRVRRGENQSATLSWIYKHTMDGRGTVTPRDVIELITKAKQWQETQCAASQGEDCEDIITGAALVFALGEVSQRKRSTYLAAEFPHFWPSIAEFEGGKSSYSEERIRELLGAHADESIKALCAIGFLRQVRRRGAPAYEIPFLYRAGLKVKQGFAGEDDRDSEEEDE